MPTDNMGPESTWAWKPFHQGAHGLKLGTDGWAWVPNSVVGDSVEVPRKQGAVITTWMRVARAGLTKEASFEPDLEGRLRGQACFLCPPLSSLVCVSPDGRVVFTSVRWVAGASVCKGFTRKHNVEPSGNWALFGIIEVYCFPFSSSL